MKVFVLEGMKRTNAKKQREIFYFCNVFKVFSVNAVTLTGGAVSNLHFLQRDKGDRFQKPSTKFPQTNRQVGKVAMFWLIANTRVGKQDFPSEGY